MQKFLKAVKMMIFTRMGFIFSSEVVLMSTHEYPQSMFRAKIRKIYTAVNRSFTI